MDNAKVSIIVPVYKVPENFLRKCVESLMSQTLREIEIILVDDGSPDDCGRICDAYASRDSRIKVIHKENGGLSAARNTGFYAATGKWVTFVDGDDWVEPNMCECLYTEGEKDAVQLVISGYYKDYGKSVSQYQFYLEDGKVYTGKECLWLQQQVLVFNCNIADIYCKLAVRDFLVREGIVHDETLRQGIESIEYNLRLFGRLQRAKFVNRPLYHYVYNENSISATSSDANNEYVIMGFEKIRQTIENSPNRETLLPWLDNRMLYAIMTTAISGFFNPLNEGTFRQRKEKFARYLEKPIVQHALAAENCGGGGETFIPEESSAFLYTPQDVFPDLFDRTHKKMAERS